MANDTPALGKARDVFTWGLSHSFHLRNFINTLGAGIWASVELATFQKNPTIQVVGKWGRRLAGMEVIVISGQVALIFLALRRRFRF